MSQRIFECEQDPDGGLVLRFHPAKMPICPEEAKVHMEVAGREALMAVRSLIDWSIQRLEEMEKKPRKKRTTKINVE
jgi:hypothetical protein